MSERMPALFLDRDGIVNVDHGYVYRIEDFEFVPGIFEVCRAARARGLALVVITNQSGIARGYFSAADYQRLTTWMQARFEAAAAPLAGVYHCPHHPGVSGALGIDCDCRKPAPGLLLRALEELQLDAARSVLVGDKARDIEAGRRAGVARNWLVSDEAGQIATAQADAVFASVSDLAHRLAAGAVAF